MWCIVGICFPLWSVDPTFFKIVPCRILIAHICLCGSLFRGETVTQSNAIYSTFSCRFVTELCPLPSPWSCSKDICAILVQLNCPGIFNFWILKTKTEKSLWETGVDYVYLQILLKVSTMLYEGPRRNKTSFYLPPSFVGQFQCDCIKLMWFAWNFILLMFYELLGFPLQ